MPTLRPVRRLDRRLRRILRQRAGSRVSDSRPANPSGECRPAASLSAGAHEASMPIANK
jgi:hypothetical protein